MEDWKITEDKIVYPLIITNMAGEDGKGWRNKFKPVNIALKTGETISKIYKIDKKDNYFLLNDTIYNKNYIFVIY